MQMTTTNEEEARDIGGKRSNERELPLEEKRPKGHEGGWGACRFLVVPRP